MSNVALYKREISPHPLIWSNKGVTYIPFYLVDVFDNQTKVISYLRGRLSVLKEFDLPLENISFGINLKELKDNEDYIIHEVVESNLPLIVLVKDRKKISETGVSYDSTI